MINKKIVYSSIVAFMFLTGCGNDIGTGFTKDNNSTEGTLIRGKLIDSAVENATYKCGTKVANTMADGTFECLQLPIEFSVGGIEIGIINQMTPDSKIFPQDLVGVSRSNIEDKEVVKIALYLQSLDDDGDISKSITIPADTDLGVKKRLTDMSISEVKSLLEDNGLVSVSEESAKNHLRISSEGDTTAPIITLNGDKTITILKGNNYTELGATAKDAIDGTVSVITTGIVDTSTVGTYIITYTATDNAGNKSATTRTVIVKENEEIVTDTTAPIITVNGDKTITILKGNNYTELGATAKDAIDGTVSVITTGTVDTSTVGTYIITYTATDNAGNKSATTRTVIVKEIEEIVTDTTAPIITVNGDKTITILKGNNYTELGATAKDAIDGTVSVITTGTVDTSTVGTYIITYTATDNAGNKSTTTRTVIVKEIEIENKAPIVTIKGNKSLSMQVGQTVEIFGEIVDEKMNSISIEWLDNDVLLANKTKSILNYKAQTAELHTIKLKVTDDEGLIGSNTIDIQVTEEANKAPIANAGEDKTVTVNNSVTLNGSGIDSDGTIVSYKWEKGKEVLAEEATLNYTPTVVGTDTLTLTVTDDDGETASDTIKITVEQELDDEVPDFGGK